MTPTLAWILVLVTACSFGALAYAMLGRRNKGSKVDADLPKQWSLTPRPVFNAHERRVHRQLREALPQQVVLAKLPLVRFCHPSNPAQVRFWFDLLGTTHVGFAICNASGRVLAAVDIDEGRAPSGPARRSVQIKQAVLAACHIRYVRYAAEHIPSVPELQLLVPSAAAQAPGPAAAGAHASVGQAGTGATAAPRARPTHWPDSMHSSFGRDSVISGFSNSLPSVLPDRDGKVVDPPPTRH